MRNALKAVTGPARDIADAVGNINSLTKFSAAIKSAGLVETLKGAGPFTLFAPSNEAFERLPEGALERLLSPENAAELTKLVSFHLIAGRIMSIYVKGKKFNRKTVNGPELALDGLNPFNVNKAKVVSADVPASNGVIHVIDAVLAPPKS